MAEQQQISQESVNHLIEDIAYLQDEADALQYVIEEVPYDQSPSDEPSIAEMLKLIDHAQISYYRPIFEDAIDTKRPTYISDFTHFEENFMFDEEGIDIHKILKKLSKHRAGVINSLKDISLMQWESIIYKDNTDITIFSFIQEMVRFERDMLKKIVNRVRVFSQERQTQRELEQRRKQQQYFNVDENTNY